MTKAAASELRRDIEYSRIGSVSLRLDASLPEGRGPFAAIIIVHGGGWVAGDRRINVQPLFDPLSKAGFAWFSISYRLANNPTDFGAAIADVTAAVKFVKAHAAEFRIDPTRIALMGESAGGQLAAMAALNGGGAGAVKAVAALYAPTDLVALAKNSTMIPPGIRDSVKGTPFESLLMAGLAQLSPINNVRRNMPPFLLIHGTADSFVPFTQSEEMCRRMKSAGASCELYPVQGAGHGIRWWESSPQLASGYKQKLVNWLHTQLG